MNILKKISLGVCGVFALWILGFAGFSLTAITAKPQGVNETTDAIVVLTGGKNRIQEGLTLFAKGRASHLFISGVFKDVKKHEILSLWDGDHALPPCCVTLGYNATTTAQNAQETRDWITGTDYSSIRLITGNYHITRSHMELKHALPGIDIYLHPVKQSDLSLTSRYLWELLFSEYHKSLYRFVPLLLTPSPSLSPSTPEENT